MRRHICCSGMVLCQFVRFEWRRHCILRILSVSRLSALSDRPPVERISVVVGEQAYGSVFSWIDRNRILRTPVAPICAGCLPGYVSCCYHRCLLDSSLVHPCTLEPDSPAFATIDDWVWSGPEGCPVAR